MTKIKKRFWMLLVFILFGFICSCSNDMNQIKGECIEGIEFHYDKIKEEAFFYTSKLVDYEISKAKEKLNTLSKKSSINKLRDTTIKRMDDLCLSESEYFKIKDLFMKDDYQINDELRMVYFEESFLLKAFLGKFNGSYFFIVDKYYDINFSIDAYPELNLNRITKFYSYDKALYSTITESVCAILNDTTYVRHNVDANIRTPLSQEDFIRFIEYNSVYSERTYKVYSEDSSFDVTAYI